MKRKPKVVEAWAVEWLHLPDTRDLLLLHTKRRADQMAKLHDSKVYHLTPADPHAKLKAAVVRAAEKLMGERAEFAESMLCALAFDHIRTHADFSCPEWTQWGEDGHCAFCDAAREVKP